MINSRQKGKRGELNLSHTLNDLLKDEGIITRRSQQYAGINNDADLSGLPFIHPECKNVERLNIYDAVDQAKRDAREGEIPTVFHKKNHKEWLVTMPLIEWIKLYKAFLNRS